MAWLNTISIQLVLDEGGAWWKHEHVAVTASPRCSQSEQPKVGADHLYQSEALRPSVLGHCWHQWRSFPQPHARIRQFQGTNSGPQITATSADVTISACMFWYLGSVPVAHSICTIGMTDTFEHDTFRFWIAGRTPFLARFARRRERDTLVAITTATHGPSLN